ncbi:MAG: tetratricopeptide repeat protein [Trueperaceae bacterium]|nr:tetratricopeptide repeat protein [Trueperaceae bacterium]
MAAYLRLFGPPRVALDDGHDLPLPIGKPVALLCYLVAQAGWVSRERAAGLLWSDKDEPRARAGLRQALYSLRNAPWARPLGVEEGLELERSRLRLMLPCDLSDFRAAVDDARWRDASTLYEAPFLQTLTLGDDAFDEWVADERQRLSQIWAEAALAGANDALAADNARRAAELAERVLREDSLSETALQTRLRAALAGYRRDDAVQVYRQFYTRLQEELGLEPLPDTQALLAALRDQPSPPTPSAALAAPARHDALALLPPQPSPFVGRDAELAQIATRLRDPDCRLLTLVGIGGSGKTRLGLQSAYLHGDTFADGAVFVPLASVASASNLAGTVADALRLSVAPAQALDDAVFAHLAEREALLVLDNFEHLTDGTGFVAALLERAPRCRVLVTSRVGLELAGEWLLDVGGLRYPSTPDDPAFERYDAVQLFLRGAQQVRARFGLDEDIRPAIVTICRLVDGLALGVELAASWLRLLSCQEVADELARDLGALESTDRDVPERHRSLEAMFEHSWHLLHDAERRTLAALSVFRGGFDKDAARHVADASLSVLLSLINRSLLLRSDSGRFDLHEVIRQGSSRKLQRAERTRYCDRHARYYLGTLTQAAQALEGDRPGDTIRSLESNLDNIRQAWHYAARQHNRDLIEQAALGIARFADMRGRYQEGIDLFEAAWRHLGTTRDAGTTEAKSAEAILKVYQARLATIVGRYDQARLLAEASLSVLRTSGNSTSLLYALDVLAILYEQIDRPGDAKRCYQEALGIAKEQYELSWMARLLFNLATLCHKMGEDDEARDSFQRSLQIFRDQGSPMRLAVALDGSGLFAFCDGRLYEARALFNEGLELARQSGSRASEANVLHNLAKVAHALGELDHAETLVTTSLNLVRDTDHRVGCIRTQITAADIALSRHALPAAKKRLREGLTLARTNRSTPYMLYGLVIAARLYSLHDDARTARQLADLARTHTLFPHHYRFAFERLDAALAAEQDASAQPLSEAPKRPLEDLVSEVIEYLSG